MSRSLDIPPMEEQPQGGGDMFRFAYGILADHRLVICTFVLVGAVLCGVLTYFMEDPVVEHYESSAMIQVKLSPWDDDMLKGTGGLRYSITAAELVERTSMRAMSEEVASAMVKQAVAEGGAASRVFTKEDRAALAANIEGKLSFAVVPNSTTKIQIRSIGCASAEEARNIAEFGTRVFLEQNRRLLLDDAEQSHSFLVVELDKLREKLFKAENSEWEYKRSTGFKNFSNLDEDMAGMYEERHKLEAKQEEIQAKLTELENGLVKNTEALPSSLGQISDGAVEELPKQLVELQKEQLRLSVVYQPGFPDLLELEEDSVELQAAIMEALEQLDGEGSGGSNLWKQRQDFYRQRMALRLDLTGTDIQLATLEHRLEEMIPQLPELAEKNLELGQLEAETHSLRDEFKLRRQQEWDIASAIERGMGQLTRHDGVKEATLMPTHMGGSNYVVNILIGMFLGFLLAFSLMLMKEMNDTSIRSIEDVNTYLGTEVLGTIPRMRFEKPWFLSGKSVRATYVSTAKESQVDASIVTQHDPKSPVSEAYRTLRTNFQFATIKSQPRTVMVTSAVPGEGKTTTVVNMAVTMADRGMRVLVVDTDLRRPNVHRMLHMERDIGLADVLRGKAEVEAVIRPTEVKNLSIISSGGVPQNPSELIASEKMTTVMAKLGTMFDIVICDAPSVLVVTDPVLLATHVDTSVMVVSTSFARRETVIRAKKLLETANVDMVGVVVNGLETSRRNYYYYYYYYQDGKSGRKKWYHI